MSAWMPQAQAASNASGCGATSTLARRGVWIVRPRIGRACDSRAWVIVNSRGARSLLHLWLVCLPRGHWHSVGRWRHWACCVRIVLHGVPWVAGGADPARQGEFLASRECACDGVAVQHAELGVWI